MQKTFKLTSPYMGSNEKSPTHAVIKNFQKNLNKLAGKYYLKKVKLDGTYGPETRELYRRVAHYLGISRRIIDRGATPYARRIIANPKLRNPVQLVRARKLAKTINTAEKRRKATVRWVKDQVGKHEDPNRPNRGVEVDRWQKDFGRWMLGQPWCGAFVGYALRHVADINVPNGIVYTPNILQWARNGTNGFEKGLRNYNQAREGDLALFKFPGASNDSVDHVGMVVGRLDDDTDTIVTVEGNTSKDAQGSQNNGGGVYLRNRPRDQFVGFARPRWGYDN